LNPQPSFSSARRQPIVQFIVFEFRLPKGVLPPVPCDAVNGAQLGIRCLRRRPLIFETASKAETHSFPIRSGDHSDVNRNRCVTTQARHLTLFQYAKELRLKLYLHLGNFVEKNGAAICLLEDSRTPIDRASESPTLVSKEFAFDQTFTKRGAVFRKIPPRSAWIRIVLGTDERNVEVSLRPFNEGSEAENPTFSIGCGSS
jgi:hypothetical protein